jgi:polyphosphate kinase 2 (PPK2 family)
VLVVRVHQEILRNERLPDEVLEHRGLWKGRYRSIVEHEDHLHRNGTRVLKFYLHLSKEEQRQRLLARLDDPEKNWKFSPFDLQERALWPDYMAAYAECLRATSTARSPWYIVPADDKRNARLIVSQAIVQAVDELKMRFPEPGEAERKKLRAMREVLAEEKGES